MIARDRVFLEKRPQERILDAHPAFLSPAAPRPPALTKAQPRRAVETFRPVWRLAGRLEFPGRGACGLPGLPIVVDCDHREESGRRQLLALHDLRRSLERRPAEDAAPRGLDVAVRRADVIRELLELIDALDRRVPHVERAGEASIAREAAALKLTALKRIAELEKRGRVERARSLAS
jgi:hypothetical protein